MPFTTSASPIPDESGYSNTGTPKNGVTWSSDNGGIYIFDGADGYIQVSDSPSLSPADQVTVECWVNYASLENVGLVWKGGYNYMIYGPEGGFVKFTCFDSSGGVSSAQFPADLIQTGTWYHIVGVLGLDHVARLYLDGQSVGTVGAAIAGVRDSAGDLFLGRRGDGVSDCYLSGLLDEVRVSGVGLSGAEVQQRYDDTKADHANANSPLHLDMPFTTSASPIPDESGYSNTGTPKNGVTWSSDNGGIYIFDGADGYIQVSDSPSLSPADQVTVECWVNYASLENVGLVWKGGYNYMIYGPEGGFVKFTCFDSSGGVSSAQFPADLIQTGTWYHIVGVLGLDHVARLYLDGQSVGTVGAAIAGVRDSAGDLFLGRRGDGISACFLDGSLDAVRVYSRGLTALEVQASYDNTKAAYS
jgi:hypothetical protein